MAGQTPGAAVGAVAATSTGESVPQQHQCEHVDVKHFPSFDQKEKGEDRCLVFSRFIGGNRVACQLN